MLTGKTIIVGVTGGIAAYKTCEIVSQLKQLDAEVWVVMTQHAAQFVAPLTFLTLSGNPVMTALFDPEEVKAPVPHITLAQKADLLLICPATANILAKLAYGIADDALTTTVLSSNSPKLIAPAMNERMWNNQIVQNNIKRLKENGFIFVEPESGWLACGEEGMGRLAEIDRILETIKEALGVKQDLKGRKVLVTAGGTREPIDPVRFIGNRSSGKMGYAIAQSAQLRGAEVILVSGKTALSAPSGVKLIEVETTKEMFEAVKDNFKNSDTLIMAAAPADFRPKVKKVKKVKKNGNSKPIELEETEDILRQVARVQGSGSRPKLVGFALETEDLIKNAKQKLKDKNLDVIVANGPENFDADLCSASIIYKNGKIEEINSIKKEEFANLLLNRVYT